MGVMRTLEAMIDADGRVQLLEPLHLRGEHRALVTILEEEPVAHANGTALLSEAALSDWNRPEEDEAWAHLQPAR